MHEVMAQTRTMSGFSKIIGQLHIIYKDFCVIVSHFVYRQVFDFGKGAGVPGLVAASCFWGASCFLILERNSNTLSSGYVQKERSGKGEDLSGLVQGLRDLRRLLSGGGA
jgi:hypothetical protein